MNEMCIAPFFICRDEERICLIHTEKMTVESIDEAEAALLQRAAADPAAAADPTVAAELYRRELFCDPSALVETGARPNGEYPVVDIALFLTQRCNLDCIYCYGDGGRYGRESHMEQTTARQAVDWLIARSGGERRLGICFFGGEPLLNFEVLRETHRYALARAAAAGKTIQFEITTNGLLLDEEKIAFFKRNGILTRVSFDGPAEVQDRQRPLRGGGGSHAIVAANIRRLLREMPDSPCRATVMADGDPGRVSEALTGIGFRKQRLTLVSPPLQPDSPQPAESPAAAAMRVKSAADARRIRAAVHRRDTSTLRALKGSTNLISYLEQFVHHEKMFFPCGAGRKYAAVASNGDVHICHRFVGQEAFRVGHIREQRLEREEYTRSALAREARCRECFAKYVCAGFCYYENLVRSGSIRRAAESSCRQKRHDAVLAALIAADLSAAEKDYLVDASIIGKKVCILDLFDDTIALA